MKMISKTEAITEVVIAGTSYQTAISLHNNLKMAKIFDCTVDDLMTQPKPEYIPTMLKHMVDGGFRLLKKENVFADNNEDFWISIIDEQPQLYGNVIKSYQEAYAKYYSIQQEGNSEAVS